MIAVDLAAEALFVSDLAAGSEPNPEQVGAAITSSLLRYGSEGCAADMAYAYGEDQAAASARMRWCLQIAAACQPVGA